MWDFVSFIQVGINVPEKNAVKFKKTTSCMAHVEHQIRLDKKNLAANVSNCACNNIQRQQKHNLVFVYILFGEKTNKKQCKLVGFIANDTFISFYFWFFHNSFFFNFSFSMQLTTSNTIDFGANVVT